MKNHSRIRAFTLVELLLVISLIAMLSAMLFPVFGSVRGKARQSSCLSNLHQLGIGVAMYAQDNDDLYPRGTVVAKRALMMQPPEPEELRTLPLLRDVMQPYLHGRGLWQCPSDIGFDARQAPVVISPNGNEKNLAPCPSMFDAYGQSYDYRLNAALEQVRFPARGYTEAPPPAAPLEIDSSQVGILMDTQGEWHGEAGDYNTVRYNVLLADGHVKNMLFMPMIKVWLLPLRLEDAVASDSPNPE